MSAAIVTAGMPMADYLALKALSQGPLQTGLDEAMAKGWWESYENNERERGDDDSEGKDYGTLAHGLLLEGNTANVEVIDPFDYPTKSSGNIPDSLSSNKDIKAAAAYARDSGKTPVLKKTHDKAVQMVAVARRYIDSLRGQGALEDAIYAAFQPSGGQSEVVVQWDERGIPCKLRTDRIATDRKTVIDFKSTKGSAHPASFARAGLSNLGYNFGAAWYRRGCYAAFGIVPEYVFLVQETRAPFLCSLVGCDPPAVALGDERVSVALNRWRECGLTGIFPGYAPRVAYPELPPWDAAKFMENNEAHGIPYDPAKLFGGNKL